MNKDTNLEQREENEIFKNLVDFSICINIMKSIEREFGKTFLNKIKCLSEWFHKLAFGFVWSLSIFFFRWEIFFGAQKQRP